LEFTVEIIPCLTIYFSAVNVENEGPINAQDICRELVAGAFIRTCFDGLFRVTVTRDL
jgi:hypothetical protein